MKRKQTPATIFLKEYEKGVFKGVRSVPEPIITEASRLISRTIKSDAQIFAFGNGGSEALARQLTYALMSTVPPEVRVHVQNNPRLEFTRMAPHSEIFSWMLRRSARPGDLAFLVSASGNSRNVCDAAITAKQIGMNTISLSANGKLVNTPEAEPDVKIVIDHDDQQMLEDASQAIAHIIARIAALDIEGAKINAKKIIDSYLGKIYRGFRQLNQLSISGITGSLVKAYLNGNTVRIDAPEGGGMVLAAFHTAHNQKWDAFQGINRHPSNRVYSGIPDCHFSGVANDGIEGMNYVLEILDNTRRGDAIIFLRHRNGPSRDFERLVSLARRKGAFAEWIDFRLGDEFAEVDMAQIAGHMLGRLVNSCLVQRKDILEIDVEETLRYDLALLRTADANRMWLERQMDEW